MIRILEILLTTIVFFPFFLCDVNDKFHQQT